MTISNDDPSKLTIYEESSESFPCLNSVYKKEVFGTTVSFKILHGKDFCDERCVIVNTMSIAFLKEYSNKSFEELRLEDYICDRKGMKRFEEKSYLKCFQHSPDSVKSCRSLEAVGLTEKDDLEIECKQEEKFSGSCDSDRNDDNEENSLIRQRLQKFFEESEDEYSPLPSEFFVDYPTNIYFMPCCHAKFVYGHFKSKRKRRNLEWLYDTVSASSHRSLFGNFEPQPDMNSLYSQLYQVHKSRQMKKEQMKRLPQKNTCRSYFQEVSCPYNNTSKYYHPTKSWTKTPGCWVTKIPKTLLLSDHIVK